MKSDTQTLVVTSSPERLFEFLAAPENLPRWAVKFCHSIRPKSGGWWYVQGCMGEIPMRYVVDRSLGVIDYHIATPGGEAVIPSRVVPAGDGAAYVFTQFQSAGMTDEMFQGQIESLKEEFEVLRDLMESGNGDRT